MINYIVKKKQNNIFSLTNGSTFINTHSNDTVKAYLHFLGWDPGLASPSLLQDSHCK